jgi:ribosomal protein L9
MVRLAEGPLKTLGEHQVKVVLHSDVSADVTVVLGAA